MNTADTSRAALYARAYCVASDRIRWLTRHEGDAQSGPGETLQALVEAVVLDLGGCGEEGLPVVGLAVEDAVAGRPPEGAFATEAPPRGPHLRSPVGFRPYTRLSDGGRW